MEKDKIEDAVRTWVESVVIGLNLCPFAKREMSKKSIRFIASEATTEEHLLLDLQDEINLLQKDDSIETTLVIHPNVLQVFEDYNQFLFLSDALLEQMQLDATFQIASFHPQYQFADTETDDVENYTNRSPYPMLHILREASLDIAIDNYPNVDDIPIQNVQRLREMGLEKIKAMLRACYE